MNPAWSRPEGAPVVIVDGAGGRAWRRLAGQIDAPAAVVRNSDPWQLARAVRGAAEDGMRFFACVGGDEAWLAVAAGTAGVDDVLVGHGGGGAALPQTFGLPHDARSCAQRLAGGGEVALDTIRVEPDAGTAVEAANMLWWGVGRRAGLVARAFGNWRIGLWVAALSRHRRTLRLRMGDVVREYGDASAFLVANGEWLGGLDVVPRAHPGDGILEVLVLEGPASDLWRMVRRMPTGSHLPHPRVRELRPATIRAEGSGRLFVDGADVGSLPATITVMPGRLRLAV